MKRITLGILILSACSISHTKSPRTEAECQYTQDAFLNLKQGLSDSIDISDFPGASWYIYEANECRAAGLISTEQQASLENNFRNSFKMYVTETPIEDRV